MKKIFFVYLLIIIMFISSACASADLTYTLSDDNKTTVRYDVSFETTDQQDVSPYLNEIGSYWADQGLTITMDEAKNTVTGEKTIKSDTVKEAAKTFGDVFSSKDSLFSNVSFTYTPSLSVDDYNFSADVSLKDVIRQQQAQSIPSDQITKIEQAAKQGIYRISISLPGEVTETNADSRDGNVCTWVLEYGKIKTLSLHTHRQNTQTVQNYNKLTGIMADNTKLLIVFASAAIFCILMIVLSIVVRRMKRKRASEVRIKHFR